MADIINLRMVRKRADRARREQDAAQSRALHGRTKDEKQRDRLVAEKAERFVAGHRLDAPGGDKE